MYSAVIIQPYNFEIAISTTRDMNCKGYFLQKFKSFLNFLNFLFLDNLSLLLLKYQLTLPRSPALG